MIRGAFSGVDRDRLASPLLVLRDMTTLFLTWTHSIIALRRDTSASSRVDSLLSASPCVLRSAAWACIFWSLARNASLWFTHLPSFSAVIYMSLNSCSSTSASLPILFHLTKMSFAWYSSLRIGWVCRFAQIDHSYRPLIQTEEHWINLSTESTITEGVLTWKHERRSVS